MSDKKIVVKCLTEHEQDTFREDFREKEREIQRYIGVYLSGLVLMTGWIVGPQTKPLIKMALDNYGYNVFAILILAALNALFTCFLIYKSLILHEIMQFVTSHSPRESGFQYWEKWHRSRQSATIRVRAVYTFLLGILPLCVSGFIIYGLWKLLHTDTQVLATTLKDIENQSLQSLSQAPSTGGGSVASTVATADQLTTVFATVRVGLWAVLVIHVIPLWFLFENWILADKRWSIINSHNPAEDIYKDLKALGPCDPVSTSIGDSAKKLEGAKQTTDITSKESFQAGAKQDRPNAKTQTVKPTKR